MIRHSIPKAEQLRPVWIAWVPLAVLLVAEAVLWFLNVQTPSEAPGVLIALNLVLAVAPWLAISVVFLRSFLAAGAPGVLALGCGAALWSASGLGSLVLYLFPGAHAANAVVTVHNLLVWAASLSCLMGAALLHRGWPTIQRRSFALLAACGLTLAASAFVAWCALKGWTPVFFVQGEGATVERQFVLGSAIVGILLTYALLQEEGNLRSPFLDWFALALLLFAAGYAGLMLQTTVGGILGWTSRAAQFLGGVYMLVAAHAVFVKRSPLLVVLTRSSDGARHRYSIAIALVLVAAVLRLVFLPSGGVPSTFVTFYPAVVLAALYGGLRAGAFATLLSTLFASYFWIPPTGSLLIASPENGLTTGIFILSCLLVSSIIERMQNAQARLRKMETERREELERLVALRTEELGFANEATNRLLDAATATETALQAVLDAVPAGIWIARDPSHRTVQANRLATTWMRIPEGTNSSKSAPSLLHFDIFDKDGAPVPIQELPLRRAARGEEVTGYEFELRFPEGESRFLRGNATPLRNADGSVAGGVAAFIDMTVRKQAEEALRRSEERYRSLFEHMLDGFAYCEMVFDEQGRPDDFVYLAVNHAFERLTGLSDVIGKRVTEVIPQIKEQAPEVFEIYGRVASTGSPERFEIDFKPLGMYLSVSVYSPAKGFFVAVFDNITERKKAGAALHRSEMRYRTLIEATSAITWSCPPSGLHVEPQPAWMAFTGQTAEEMLGDGWGKVIHPEDLPATTEKWAAAVACGEPFAGEHRIRRKDGCWRWMSTHAAPIRDAEGKIVEWFGMNIDITARKEAEEALRESEAQLQAVLDGSLDPIFMKDRKGRMVLANPATWTAIGKPAGAILGKTDEEFLDNPADARAIMANDRRIMLSGEPETVEEVVSTPSGARYYVNKKAPRRDAAGKVIGLISTARDITERKRAEQALRESEERFRGIFHDAGTAIAITDLEGGVQSCNPAFTAMLGYTEQELVGRHFQSLVHQDDRKEQAEAIARLRAREIPSCELLNRYVRKDSSAVWVHKRVSLLKDAAGKPTNLIALITDMTERKRYEEHIKLLLKEVNHRAKNMLSVVQSIARQTAAANADDFVERFAERIRSLAASQDLLVKSAWHGVDLEDLVRSQLAHFGDLIGVRIAAAGPPLTITASAAQTIGMALHELSTNAGKYGALSNASGRVDVAWSLTRQDGLERFAMEWRESGGPPVSAPRRQGFGSIVISQMVKLGLDADVVLDYAPGGVVWRLECPSDNIVERRR